MSTRRKTPAKDAKPNEMNEEDKESFRAEKMSIVKRNLLIVLPLTAIFFFGGYYLFPFKLPQMDSYGDRLQYAMKWQILPVLTIFKAIQDIGKIRGSTTACDPISGNSEHLLKIPQNILQNTIEQYVMYFTGQVMLCSYLTSDSMKAIPLLAIIFFVARLLYAAGYSSSDPANRSIGFGPTFFPTIFVMLYCFVNFLWIELPALFGM